MGVEQITVIAVAAIFICTQKAPRTNPGAFYIVYLSLSLYFSHGSVFP